MKAVWLVIGILLFLAGVGWIAALMVEVFFQKVGFTSLSKQIWGFLAFHTVAMYLGMLSIERMRSIEKASKARKET